MIPPSGWFQGCVYAGGLLSQLNLSRVLLPPPAGGFLAEELVKQRYALDIMFVPPCGGLHTSVIARGFIQLPSP